MASLVTSVFNDDLEFEYVDGTQLRTVQPKTVLSRMHNKSNVYDESMYFVPIYERDIASMPTDRYVYSKLGTNVELLDNLRLQSATDASLNEGAVRATIAVGLVSLYYQVAVGKIYDVPLNPLNYVIDRNNNGVRAFYRYDHALPEITDEWLYTFKKLIAYYLVSDSHINVSDFDRYSVQDLIQYMDAGSRRGFEKVYAQTNIADIAELLVPDSRDLKALQSYYALDRTLKAPVNRVVNGGKSNDSTEIVMINTADMGEPQEPIGTADDQPPVAETAKERRERLRSEKQMEREQQRLAKETKRRSSSKDLKNVKAMPREKKQQASGVDYVTMRDRIKHIPGFLVWLLIIIFIIGGLYIGGMVSKAVRGNKAATADIRTEQVSTTHHLSS